MCFMPEVSAMRDRAYMLRRANSDARQTQWKRFKIKLDQLRKDIQAGIASGDAGTLGVD